MTNPNINLLGTGEALDTSVNTIISKFKLLNQETPVVKPTATQLDLERGMGPTYYLNNYRRVVAFNLVDGVDMMQAQTLADDQSTYSPSEVGVQVILPGSTLRRSADRRLEANTAKMMNNGWDLKEDTDGCTQFASFTMTALGSAGTVASPGHVAAGAAKLRIGGDRSAPEPAPKPWNTVLHPLTTMVIGGRIIPFATTPGGGTAYGVNTGAHAGVTVSSMFTELQQRLLLEGPGALGRLSGTIVREDANISVDSSDDAIGAIYSSEGLVYINEVSAQMDPDTSDKSLRGSIEMNLWGSYGWGLYRPANYGQKATFDASVPTS